MEKRNGDGGEEEEESFSRPGGEKSGDGEGRTILSNKGIEERGGEEEEEGLFARLKPHPLLLPSSAGAPPSFSWKTCLHIH